MSLLIVFLTFILVMNCLFLMLLILIQLPKKEAGAGIAFGGAATDALFGAGSGNALTKVTKYSASLFVGLAVLLSTLNMHAARQGSRRLEQELSRQAGVAAPAAPTLPATNLSAKAAPLPPATNSAAQTTVAVSATNPPAVTLTNRAASTNPTVHAEAPAAPTK